MIEINKSILTTLFIFATPPGWRTCLPAVGLTNNVERRLAEHNNKENRSTKAYCPFKLILKDRFERRIEARKREKYLKSGTGKEFLKLL